MWQLALICTFAASTLILFGMQAEAHNISVNFPNEVVVDIGDVMRWLTLNPNGSPPNPTTYIQIWAKNVSTSDVDVCVTAKDGSLVHVNCPTAPITVGSGGGGNIICTVDINAYSGTPTTKNFVGPEHVETIELNILVIDPSATSCTSYTTLYNWYTEDINVIVLDTNDPSWTKVYERNGDVTTDVYVAETSTYIPVDDIGFAKCPTITSISNPVSTTTSGCRSGACYKSYSTNWRPQFFKFSGINASGYTECYIVGYVRPGSYSDGVGLFLEGDNIPCYGPLYARLYYYKSNAAYPNDWAQIAARVPTAPDVNVIMLIYYDLYGDSISGGAHVDDVRVYCR